MCGITGCVWTDPSLALSREALASMTDVLQHRGPDDEGAYVSEYVHQPPYSLRPGAALGFRRLSIIDPDGSHQPLSNEDGTIHVIFNGEIYNYRELRSELEAHGCAFRTSSDTEVLLQAWIVWGAACLPKLNGGFAFAVYDRDARTLALARDRFGKRPLYFAEREGGLLFASEMKAFLAYPGFRFAQDADQIAHPKRRHPPRQHRRENRKWQRKKRVAETDQLQKMSHAASHCPRSRPRNMCLQW